MKNDNKSYAITSPQLLTELPAELEVQFENGEIFKVPVIAHAACGDRHLHIVIDGKLVKSFKVSDEKTH